MGRTWKEAVRFILIHWQTLTSVRHLIIAVKSAALMTLKYHNTKAKLFYLLDDRYITAIRKSYDSSEVFLLQYLN
jgi:hypothetical protein